MTISISNLRLKTRIGVSEKERAEQQEVLVSLSYVYDAASACEHDLIHHAVDYREVRDRIVETVQSSQCMLIETLARNIVAAIAEEPRIAALRVQVEKPRALRLADSVSAMVSWERREGEQRPEQAA